MHPRKIIILSLLVLFTTTAAQAQTERWEPFVPSPNMASLRVWTSGERTHARVVLTFPTGGHRITDIGPVVRQGSDLSVDIAVERWTGITTQALVVVEHFFDLGTLPGEPGTFTFTLKSRGNVVKSVSFDPRQIVEHWEETSLERDGVGFAVWTSGGVTFTSVSLNFPDEGYRVAEWGEPERVGNDFVVRVRLERWTGRASVLTRKREQRLFVLGQLPPHETFTVSVQFTDGVRHTSAPFTPAGQSRPPGTNPIDDPAFFVRQHYLDFLGREPDAGGLTFWYNEITNTCMPFTTECVELRREQVSAAFYFSFEFQGTGFFVYRLHKAAFGPLPRFNVFIADTRRAAEGVIVGFEGWERKIEENQRRVAEEFVAREEFKARYPETMTPEDYVRALDCMIAHDFSETECGPLTAAEKQALADGLRDGTETRGSVLRKIADHPDFRRREFNRAFVLMEYFGYLRRGPSDPPDDARMLGYNFWLVKLNQNGGDFRAAQMVRSFLDSFEYRDRFIQP